MQYVLSTNYLFINMALDLALTSLISVRITNFYEGFTNMPIHQLLIVCVSHRVQAVTIATIAKGVFNYGHLHCGDTITEHRYF